MKLNSHFCISVWHPPHLFPMSPVNQSGIFMVNFWLCWLESKHLAQPNAVLIYSSQSRKGVLCTDKFCYTWCLLIPNRVIVGGLFMAALNIIIIILVMFLISVSATSKHIYCKSGTWLLKLWCGVICSCLLDTVLPWFGLFVFKLWYWT